MTKEKELIDIIKKFNKNIKTSYSGIGDISKSQIRSRIRTMAEVYDIERYSSDNIKMTCIDGSVNKVGGSFPHYIEIYQSLAMISNMEDRSKSTIYSPLIDGGSEDEDMRKKHLAKIEIDLAIDLAENIDDLDLILMDGGLVRYSIDAQASFHRLKDLVLKKDIILGGFIKEIKTDFVYETLFPEYLGPKIYDKDLLYGVLEPGQALIFPEEIISKAKEGFYSCFLRLASFPGVTGIDLLKEQKSNIKDLAGLAYILTPPKSRGVPMIIDMVDAKARLGDDLSLELIKSNIDRDIYERFFVSERSLRKY